MATARPSRSEAKPLMSPKGESLKKTAKKKSPPSKPSRKTLTVSPEERMEPQKTVPKKTPTTPVKPIAQPYFYANGKRKTSVSTVRLHTNGKGIITVNARALEHYFPVFTDQDKILAPLRVTNTQKMFDVTVKVFGGGIHSQAEAVRHGISKALLEYSAELRTTLKPLGFLTRDPRVKERKKYGLHRARRAPQWQKR